MASPSDIDVVRGASFDAQFTLFDDTGQTQPTDLTAKRAIIEFSERGTRYLRVDTGADPSTMLALGGTSGTVTLHLNRAHTLQLQSSCNYMLILVDLSDSNEVEPVLSGRANVTPLQVELS